MKKTLYILAIAAAFASCNGSSKISSDNNDISGNSRKKPVCGKLHVDMNEPHLDWFEENSSILNKSTELLVLPKEYKVYSIDSTQLSAFFKAIANNKTVSTTVPLPKPAECQLFTVSKHSFKTSDANLPGAVTAKGVAKGQELALRYYQGALSGYMSWFEIDYQITTKYIESKPYILVYTKEYIPANPDDTKNLKREIVPVRQDYVK